MTTRKTFLSRTSAALGLLVAGGPAKLYAAFRRPTLTEALADGEWRHVEYVFGTDGFKSMLVDGQEVRWRLEEQPPNGIARRPWDVDNIPTHPLNPNNPQVFDMGSWRKEVEHNRTSVERQTRNGWWQSRSLPVNAPAGKVLSLW